MRSTSSRMRLRPGGGFFDFEALYWLFFEVSTTVLLKYNAFMLFSYCTGDNGRTVEWT